MAIMVRISYRSNDMPKEEYIKLDRWLFENYNAYGIEVRDVSMKSCIAEITFQDEAAATMFKLRFPNVVRSVSTY